MAGTSNLISGIGGVADAYNQTQGMALQSEFQQKMFERNERMAKIQAEDAVRRGERDASKLRKGVRGVIGRQRAALAAQGIAIDSGDALTIQEETASFGALDAITLKTNAWREAWGYRMNAEIASMQGQMTQAASKNQMFSTALTGGLNFLSAGMKAGYHYGGNVFSQPAQGGVN